MYLSAAWFVTGRRKRTHVLNAAYRTYFACNAVCTIIVMACLKGAEFMRAAWWVHAFECFDTMVRAAAGRPVSATHVAYRATYLFVFDMHAHMKPAEALECISCASRAVFCIFAAAHNRHKLVHLCVQFALLALAHVLSSRHALLYATAWLHAMCLTFLLNISVL